MTQTKYLATVAAGALLALTAACTIPTHTTTEADPAKARSANAKPGRIPATTALAALPVRKAAAMSGYSRGRFGPAWTDNADVPLGHNSCRTRDDILRTQLRDVALDDDKCTVLAGTLDDPYTGRTIAFRRGPTSSAVQIDHVVALAASWRTGAAGLTQADRTRLANHPVNLQATEGKINSGKGDDDAAQWLPPRRAYHCTYAARQIAVKRHFKLSVTRAEQRALNRVLADCPTQQLPRVD